MIDHALDERDRLRGLVEAYDSAFMDPTGPWAIVPRTAPDAVFDAAWDKLREDRFSRLTQKMSIHDGRILFRAIWTAMLCACNETEARRFELLKQAAEAIRKPE